MMIIIIVIIMMMTMTMTTTMFSYEDQCEAQIRIPRRVAIHPATSQPITGSLRSWELGKSGDQSLWVTGIYLKLI